MANLIVGEIAVPGERFPELYLAIDGKRYRLNAALAHRFGYAVMEAARQSVARVDIDALRPVVAAIEVIPLPDGREGEPAPQRGAGMPGEEMPPASSPGL